MKKALLSLVHSTHPSVGEQVSLSEQFAKILRAELVIVILYDNALEHYGNFDHLAPGDSKEQFLVLVEDNMKNELHNLQEQIKCPVAGHPSMAYKVVILPSTAMEKIKYEVEEYELVLIVVDEHILKRGILGKKLVVPQWLCKLRTNLFIFRRP